MTGRRPLQAVLTSREVAVVRALAEGPVDVWGLASAMCRDDEWDDGYRGDGRTMLVVCRVDSVVQHIRHKFGAETIRYERGRGYTLAPGALRS